MDVVRKFRVFVPTLSFMLIYKYGCTPGFENIFVI